VEIVFLTHYFPPEVNAPASRTHEHCREWVKRGHDVTVVTCTPNHPFGRVYDGYHNLLWQVENIEGIRVIRLWTFLAPNEGVWKRAANYASYMLVATLAAPFLPRPHVVISTSPQFFCGLAGYIVSRVHRAPWVLEIRDLWPDSIAAVGALHRGWAINLCERVEACAYRKADKIVTVTDSFRSHIRERGAAADKIVVVKNGVDLEQFGRPERDHGLARELGVEGRFTAAYFGTHGMAHGLDVVLRAAALLGNDPRIVFLLVGDGAERRGLQAMQKELGLTNIVMLEQQSKERMPALWGLADVALVMLRKSDVFKMVIPSKIFEAMGAGRPIVLGVEGETRDIIERAGCGIPIEPENPEELAAAVHYLAGRPKLAREMGARGRAYVAREHDRRVLAARLADVLAELVRTPVARAEPTLANRARRAASDLVGLPLSGLRRHRADQMEILNPQNAPGRDRSHLRQFLERALPRRHDSS
jgi:glycosyltransferase involved in cell wall biosynthesis